MGLMAGAGSGKIFRQTAAYFSQGRSWVLRSLIFPHSFSKMMYFQPQILLFGIFRQSTNLEGRAFAVCRSPTTPLVLSVWIMYFPSARTGRRVEIIR